MTHIMVRKSFKEVLRSLPPEGLYLSRREALFLAEKGGLVYPVAIIPKEGGTMMKVQRGGHFLDQVPLATVLLSIAGRFEGEVLQSTVPARLHSKPIPPQYVTPRVWLEKGGIRGLLGEAGPLLVEIGFGNGEFLERLVGPGRRVVGIELSNWSIRRTLNRLRGKDSYVILKAPGAWALQWLFPEESVNSLFILFMFSKGLKC